MRNIRNSREDIRRRKGKIKGGNQREETNDERLWTQGFRGEGVGGCVSLVKDIKEGMYSMERWVLCANNESWNFTSKTKDVLYGD